MNSSEKRATTLLIILGTGWLTWSVEASDCAKFGTCSQTCHLNGTFAQCSCVEGFVLGRDKKSCESNDSTWKLLYTTKHEVGLISLDKKTFQQNTNFTIATGQHPVDVAFDADREVVYWTDAGSAKERVYKAHLKGDRTVQVVIDVGLLLPEGIAFDWITGNLYVVDSQLAEILVCKESPTICTVLIKEVGAKPRDVALHPNLGLVFWTDWGQVPKVMRAGMDGELATAIVSTDLKWPNGIAVDEPNSRIYWTDARFDKIETSLLDGTDRRKIPVEALHPFGVDVFGDRLFWSDWNFKDIKSANKFTGKRVKVHAYDMYTIFSGLALMHKGKQPKLRSNPCKTADCSHICMLASDTSLRRFKCACPQGMVRDQQHPKLCIENKNEPKVLIFVQNRLATMGLMDIGMSQEIMKRLPLSPDVQSINALVYSPVNHSVIMSVGDKVNKIIQYNLDSGEYTVLVTDTGAKIIAMDLDITSENLYWINDVNKTVEALSLRTGSRVALISDVEDFTDLVFVPENGTLYLSKKGSIHKFIVGGHNNNTLFLETGNMKPSALFYDHVHQQILWICRENRTLESTSILNKTSKTICHPIDPFTSDLVRVGNKIVWVDSSGDVNILITPGSVGPRVIKTDHLTNSSESSESYSEEEQVATKNFLAIANKNISHLDKLLRHHECSWKNVDRKKCSHICLPTLQEFVGECRCPHPLILTEDQLTCHDPQKANSDEGFSETTPGPQSTTITFCSETTTTYYQNGESSEGTEASILRIENSTDKSAIHSDTVANTWLSVGFISLCILVIVLLIIIVALVSHWRRTRSIPLITKPFYIR